MNEMPYTDAKGRVYKYGEFFPIELGAFGYNQTMANEYFPLTKEQARGMGYPWKDPVEKHPAITLTSADMAEAITDVTDDILKQTIACEHKALCLDQCTVAFRIVASELAMYRQTKIPLPRFCPNCRHYKRLALRNPLQLWHRQCMCEQAGHSSHAAGRCAVEFETSYAPDRLEIVYCEQCYQQEVI